MTLDERRMEALWHRGLFKVFCKMHAVRDFRLVLCANVWDPLGEYTVGVLKQAVTAERAAKRLDYLPLEPLAVYVPQTHIIS